eukprot:CAMPEP_0198646212 /NCGR_PEP_ID=MMETSP1467-20131203/1741_1 /TAXON_ID=1462469 /ORGANISM="unid. sp., Strain CCMP2135" /LENGTH=86 /DNA_ID=CAMNT_0044381729 /DNA_START=29 /DNA_END=287 /DNA_ORIENTATION=-
MIELVGSSASTRRHEPRPASARAAVILRALTPVAWIVVSRGEKAGRRRRRRRRRTRRITESVEKLAEKEADFQLELEVANSKPDAD